MWTLMPVRRREELPVRVSAFMYLTDESIGPVELATALEERAFSGLWVPEHPHIPAARATPVPTAYGGGDLPRMYLRLLDPFVALTAAASATSSLRLGTGVCLLALRDAVVTAKEVATLDFLSGGRVDFGVGYGWNEDEFTDHGQRFDERHGVVRDKVELMRRLWADDVAEYSGRHVTLQPSWSWPKPVQPPSPPVWLGGSGPTTMREAARWASGWFPTPSAHLDDDIDTFRKMVVDAGREPHDVSVGIAAAPADGDRLRSWRERRVDEVAVVLPSAGRDDVLAHLDHVVAIRDGALR
jgi:probable F420-dependent oxidoreductase